MLEECCRILNKRQLEAHDEIDKNSLNWDQWLQFQKVLNMVHVSLVRTQDDSQRLSWVKRVQWDSLEDQHVYRGSLRLTGTQKVF